MYQTAIKYRAYPDSEQETFFVRSFGCCRKVWNLMLADKEDAYKRDKTILHPTPAQYKKDYPFLKEADSLALANVQLHLQAAYKNFFTVKGTKHPKFKSKKTARASYTTNNQKGTVSIDLENGTIRLPKAGNVKIVIHRIPEPAWNLKSATVSMERDGSYYISILFEIKEVLPQTREHPELNAVGLDYKSDGLYTDSNGDVSGSPKYYRKAQKRRTHVQRGLRNKEEGSNNYKKHNLKLAKLERHVANQRKDHLHQLSTTIAKRYDLVAVETLDMKAMSNKGFGNGKVTLDNGWGMFVRMLEYKLARRGKVLIKVDKWYPSSQLCHCCGTQNPELKDLSIRKWICPSCGSEHDRDTNAAINIREEGIRLYLSGVSA